MRWHRFFVGWPGGLLVVAACASSQVVDRERLVHEPIPRPGRIWVHDFVATPEDVHEGSGFAAHAAEQTPPTAEQIETGRRVGAEIVTHLVEKIRATGMPAERATRDTAPALHEVVIRGYLLSLEEGSAAKRMMIGFGSGASELKVAVEGDQMTRRGLRRLGSGTVDAGGSRSAGVGVPSAVALATRSPVGLIVVGGVQAYGEASGKSKVEGRAEAVAQTIAEQLEKRFREEGWIE